MSLTQSATVVTGAVHLVRNRWADLGDDDREQVVSMLRRGVVDMTWLLEQIRRHPDVRDVVASEAGEEHAPLHANARHVLEEIRPRRGWAATKRIVGGVCVAVTTLVVLVCGWWFVSSVSWLRALAVVWAASTVMSGCALVGLSLGERLRRVAARSRATTATVKTARASPLIGPGWRLPVVASRTWWSGRRRA